VGLDVVDPLQPFKFNDPIVLLIESLGPPRPLELPDERRVPLLFWRSADKIEKIIKEYL